VEEDDGMDVEESMEVIRGSKMEEGKDKFDFITCFWGCNNKIWGYRKKLPYQRYGGRIIE